MNQPETVESLQPPIATDLTIKKGLKARSPQPLFMSHRQPEGMAIR
jgi:hypothetical protein